MKLFVVSDVHSFFTEMKNALDEAGFDPQNPEHLFVGCGDYFDRGSESQQMLDYLLELPNKVLVKGNHESLFETLCDRGYAESHDFHNGTTTTVLDLAPNALQWDVACSVAYYKMKPLLDQMVNYFETEKYIFIHGWIPVIVNDDLPAYYTRNRKFEFNPDWRIASSYEWEQARWLNGINMANNGFIIDGKTIVCGHWHCSYGHHLDSMNTKNEVPEFGNGAIWEPYRNTGVIAIDRCTAYTKKVNVLVIEDNFLD